MKNTRGNLSILISLKSDSRECRFELDTLAAAEKKFRKVLNIVSVSTDDNFETASKLWKERGYPWELLDGTKKKKLIEDYNAQIVPSFYLIDPLGKLILSPAPAPSHEFEAAFLKIYREQGTR